MDSHHRPSTTPYYPPPPTHDDPHSPNTRGYPAAIPYTHRETMPPPTPLSASTKMNGSTSATHVHPPPSPSPHINGNVDKSNGPIKQNRLSKACDGCSVRKVKCDEEGPPCRACRSLQIPCTFNRPSRRRGPPNRHAEAIKKQKLDFDAVHGEEQKPSVHNAPWEPSPTASFESPSTVFPPYTHMKHLTAESLCPFDLICLLVDDFFVYMHPLHPFPHEPSFRESLFHERRDAHDPRFLALLASMIGALVASYPRRPLKRLKDLHRKHLFRTSLDFINRCRDVAIEARGPGLLGRRDIGNVDAATSYFLGHMATNTFSVSEGELYLGECFNILRAMGYQRYHAEDEAPSSAPTAFGQAPNTPHHANILDREVARRIYWALYITVRSAFTFAFGSGVADIHFNPNTPLRRHPPLPTVIDDIHLSSDGVDEQSDTKGHPLTAFITMCRLHMAYEPIKAWKLSWSVDGHLDRDKQNSLYLRCLDNARRVLEEDMPEDFQLGTCSTPMNADMDLPSQFAEQRRQNEESGGILSPSVGSTPHLPGPATTNANGRTAEAGRRREIAIEIYKANVHVTYLTARSFYLEKYWNSNGMAESIIGMTMDQMQQERLSTAKKLLHVLTQVRPAYMEPNSFSFCMKIRQIASTLFNASSSQRQEQPQTLGEQGDAKPPTEAIEDPNEVAQAYVNEFLKILMGLEKGSRGLRNEGRGSEGGVEIMNDEEELREWADLRQSTQEGPVAPNGTAHAQVDVNLVS